mmetsp:Transcript_38062/g.91324  ORF Transcript_38062/g.91324 Transcript_38062/m.91324 type:complete len:317 (-) Transcript_38062:233-1183(-)
MGLALSCLHDLTVCSGNRLRPDRPLDLSLHFGLDVLLRRSPELVLLCHQVGQEGGRLLLVLFLVLLKLVVINLPHSIISSSWHHLPGVALNLRVGGVRCCCSRWRQRIFASLRRPFAQRHLLHRGKNLVGGVATPIGHERHFAQLAANRVRPSQQQLCSGLKPVGSSFLGVRRRRSSSGLRCCLLGHVPQLGLELRPLCCQHLLDCVAHRIRHHLVLKPEIHDCRAELGQQARASGYRFVEALVVSLGVRLTHARQIGIRQALGCGLHGVSLDGRHSHCLVHQVSVSLRRFVWRRLAFLHDSLPCNRPRQIAVFIV